MNIVVLDGYAVNPGDLDWQGLRALGSCEIFDRTSSAQAVPRAAEAEIVLTNKVPLGAETITELPRLQYIGVMATGHNIIATTAARARGIVVCNVPAYGSASVAQHTFALLLELTQHVGQHSESVRAGKWARSLDWCYWERPLVELAGLTLGIVGYGRVGQAVATIGRAFGMRVVTSSTRASPEEYRSMDDLFRTSDVISLHCPLTAETRGLIDARRLALVRPSAFLINTGRGQLIVEHDLAAALNNGRIAGAGLDVLSEEPPSVANPLVTAKNCVITPHIAWATHAARQRLLTTTIENVAAFMRRLPQNVVN